MPDGAGANKSLAKSLLGFRATSFPSGARGELLELARSLPDVVALGRGDPDLPTPPHVVAAAEDALRAGRTNYSPLRGLDELRAAVARKLARDNGLKVDPDREVLITTGTQEAVMVTALTMLGADDEWIMPDPFYFSYARAVWYAGGQVVTVPTSPQNGYQPDPSEIERRINSRTKAIVLLTPHNPTGAVYSRPVLEAVAELSLSRDLFVISDEVYEKVVYPGHEHLSIGSFPGMSERTITINGFSKSYRMTGWRLGYMAGPADFISAAVTIRHTLSICAPSISQYAGVAALNGPQDCVAEALAIYQDRLEVFLRQLTELSIPHYRPAGTFYIFADVSWSRMSSAAFCLDLLRNAQVLLNPGSDFGPGGEGFVRFSLLAPLPRLMEGLDRLGSYMRRLGV